MKTLLHKGDVFVIGNEQNAGVFLKNHFKNDTLMAWDAIKKVHTCTLHPNHFHILNAIEWLAPVLYVSVWFSWATDHNNFLQNTTGATLIKPVFSVIVIEFCELLARLYIFSHPQSRGLSKQPLPFTRQNPFCHFCERSRWRAGSDLECCWQHAITAQGWERKKEKENSRRRAAGKMYKQEKTAIPSRQV